MPRRITKKLHDFHGAWVNFLSHATVQTMRRAAHEIFDLHAANVRYQDAEFMRLLLDHLEGIIQQQGRTKNWTVLSSRRSGRGRVHGAATRCSRQVKRHIAHGLRAHMLPRLEESEPA